MFRGEYLKELLKPELYIYYIRDNLITQNYFKKMVLEQKKTPLKVPT
jgi:hypothetical protein